MITHIWIDADSCPLLVRNYVIKRSKALNTKLTFVANKEIPAEDNSFQMIITDGQKDSADNYIYENANPGTDLVITRDIVFAGRLLEKGVITINDRGTEFTKEIIKERLSERDFNLQLAQMGLTKPYHEGYDKKKFEKFANCFDRVWIRNL